MVVSNYENPVVICALIFVAMFFGASIKRGTKSRGSTSQMFKVSSKSSHHTAMETETC